MSGVMKKGGQGLSQRVVRVSVGMGGEGVGG